MARLSKKMVESVRDEMIHDLHDWAEEVLHDDEEELPGWAWWVADDAGIGARNIAAVLDGEDPEWFLRHLVSQIENASYDQIRGYQAARDAWIDRP